MVVQTLFFKLVASKQYVNVLNSKMDLIDTFLEKDSEAQEEVNRFKREYLETNRGKAAEQEALREKINTELTQIYSYKIIAAAVVVLLGILIFMKSKTPWSRLYTLSLLLVLLGYTTELLFFFFIVQKYEIVGDQYIISHIAHRIHHLFQNEKAKRQAKIEETFLYKPYNELRAQIL